MKKPMIKTDFSRLRDADLNTQGQAAAAAMNDNPNFKTVAEEVARESAAADAYSLALAAMASGGKDAKARKDAARTELLKALRVLGIKINLEADGDEALLRTTGYPLVAVSNRRGAAAMPEGLSATPEPGHGNMKMAVDRVEGAKTYLFQYTKAPVTAESSWINAPATKAVVHVSGLEPRVEYAFSVAAICATAGILFSEPVYAYTA